MLSKTHTNGTRFGKYFSDCAKALIMGGFGSTLVWSIWNINDHIGTKLQHAAILAHTLLPMYIAWAITNALLTATKKDIYTKEGQLNLEIAIPAVIFFFSIFVGSAVIYNLAFFRYIDF